MSRALCVRQETEMSTAEAVATKIEKKVEDALYGLDREMTIMKWPPEYRSIMWEAVAQEATRRACAARS